jgi:hypothetical protein
MVRKIAERTIVGQVSIGRTPTAPVTPPITPPITPPGTATFLADHKKIKKYIDSQGKKYLCPLIDEIAGTTGLSEDVVRLHLDVMDEDESIAVVGKGTNPPICGVDSMSRLIVNLRKLRT